MKYILFACQSKPSEIILLDELNLKRAFFILEESYKKDTVLFNKVCDSINNIIRKREKGLTNRCSMTMLVIKDSMSTCESQLALVFEEQAFAQIRTRYLCVKDKNTVYIGGLEVGKEAAFIWLYDFFKDSSNYQERIQQNSQLVEEERRFAVLSTAVVFSPERNAVVTDALALYFELLECMKSGLKESRDVLAKKKYNIPFHSLPVEKKDNIVRLRGTRIALIFTSECTTPPTPLSHE